MKKLRGWFIREPRRTVQFEAINGDDDNDDIELASPKADQKKKDPSLFSSSFFIIYYRAFLLLGDEIGLGVALCVANIFLSIALLAEPVLFGKVINTLTQLGNGNGGSLWSTLFPLLISWSSFSLFGACASIFIGLFADQLAHRKRHVVYALGYEHALTKSPIASKHVDAGKIKKVMDEGRDACFWNWLNILRTELVSFLALLFLLPLSFYLNPYMAISIVLLCVVFGATTGYVSSQASGLQHALTQHYMAEGSLVSDVLSNLALVQSFGIVTEEVTRLRGIGNKLLSVQYPVLFYWALVVSINQCATSIAVLCVVMEGAWLFSHGLISIGQIVTFISFVTMVVNRLAQVVGAIQRMTRDVSKLEAFFGVIDAPPAVTESPQAVAVGRLKGDVVFDNVCFAYEGKTNDAVKGVSFTILSGQSLALVGSSGTNETTIFRMILWVAYCALCALLRS